MALSEFIFMFLIGGFLGILGLVVERPLAGVLCAVLLIALFGGYTIVLKQNEGIWSGLIAGIIIGTISALISLLLGGRPGSFQASVMFGLIRGGIFGGIAGVITRARPNKGDPVTTRVFLAGGSVLMGVVFGGGVGLITGVFLGVIHNSQWGTTIMIILGAIIGGYLAPIGQKRLFVFIAMLIGGATAVFALWPAGVIEGLFIGMLSGAAAPMLIVALIGVYGGLMARGPLAMLIEAIEAPREMIIQGAVPFLAPSVLMGLIIGATAQGMSSLLALPAVLGAIGLFLGALREVERRPSHRISSQAIIDTIIIGADKWPIRKTVDLLLLPHYRKKIFVSLLLSIVTGIGGGLGGMFMINTIIEFLQKVTT